MLTEFGTQALVLTTLATLAKYSTGEVETRTLYKFLAEGATVFPRVFPLMYVFSFKFFYISCLINPAVKKSFFCNGAANLRQYRESQITNQIQPQMFSNFRKSRSLRVV